MSTATEWWNSLDEWRGRLEGVTDTPSGIKGLCPAHDDTNPSLLVDVRKGKVVWRCHAGCEQMDVVAAAEGEAGSVPIKITSRKARPAYAPTGEKVADQVGGLWRPPLRDRGISPSDLHGGLPTLTGVPLDQPVVLTEGHGPAIALNAAGIPAVCTVTGKAGTLSEVGATFLYGRRVVLSPDVGGDEHMERCGAIVARVAAEVLRAPEWPQGMAENEDAADFIARHGPKAMRDHYAAAVPWVPAAIDDEDFLVEWASELDLTPPKPLLLDYLEPDDYTVLFGDGGTGKGVVAAWWVAELIRGGWVVVLLDYEQNTMREWAPRVERFGGDLSRLRVIQASGAIWDHAERVRDEVARAGEARDAPVYVVVDSIGYPVGDSKLEDSSTATKYKKALNVVGVPALSLAHTTKQNADPRWPFGSVFWHNNVRHTIGIARKEDGEDSPRVLRNKKVNRRAPFPAVEIDWSWVYGELPDRLDFRAPGLRTSARVAEALASGPLSVKEIVAALAGDGSGSAVSETAVSAVLNRGDEFFSDGKRPARWVLVGDALRNRKSVELEGPE